MTSQILYTVDQAASILSICRTTLYEEMKARRLRYVIRGRSRRIFHDDLIDFALTLRSPSPWAATQLRTAKTKRLMPKSRRRRKGGCDEAV